MNDSASVYVIATGGGSLGISNILTAGGASSYFAGAEIPYNQVMLDECIGEVWDGKYCSERTAHQLAAKAYDRAFKLEKLDSIGIGMVASLTTGPGEREGRINQVYIAVMRSWFESYTFHYVFDDRTRNRALQEVDCATFLQRIIQFELKEPGMSVTPTLFDTPCKPYLVFNDVATGQIEALKLTKVTVFPGSFNPMHDCHIAMINHVIDTTNQHPIIEVSLSHNNKGSISPYEYRLRYKAVRKLFPRAPIVHGSEPQMVDKYHQYMSMLSARACSEGVIINMRIMMGADVYNRISPEDKDDIRMLVFRRGSSEVVTHPNANIHTLHCDHVSSTEIRQQLRDENKQRAK